MFFGAAARADDFLAIAVLPIRVYDHQHDRRFRLNLNHADCMPSLLTGIVYPVETHETTPVFKDQRC